jgi:hypothetical protein
MIPQTTHLLFDREKLATAGENGRGRETSMFDPPRSMSWRPGKFVRVGECTSAFYDDGHFEALSSDIPEQLVSSIGKTIRPFQR